MQRLLELFPIAQEQEEDAITLVKDEEKRLNLFGDRTKSSESEDSNSSMDSINIWSDVEEQANFEREEAGQRAASPAEWEFKLQNNLE